MSNKQANLATNRRARHDYFIEEKYEAGIELKGTEVKSLRQGHANIGEAYCRITDRMEMFIEGMHISPYEQGNIQNKDPLRTRKLLLHKREIERLSRAVQQQGYTIIPLRVYLNRGLVKIEIAKAKGKQQHDKRQSIAKRDAERRMQQAMRR